MNERRASEALALRVAAYTLRTALRRNLIFKPASFPETTDEPSAAAQCAFGHSVARLCRHERAGTLESDPSAVDLQPDHASARHLVCAQASGERPPDHNDLAVYGWAGHRRAVHICPGPHHACGYIRALTAAPKQRFPHIKKREMERVFDWQ